MSEAFMTQNDLLFHWSRTANVYVEPDSEGTNKSPGTRPDEWPRVVRKTTKVGIFVGDSRGSSANSDQHSVQPSNKLAAADLCYHFRLL